MTPERVSIVIAAFNEEEQIGHVVAELRRELPAAELIVVDDGSADATARVAREAGARVLRSERNRGQGASLKAGALDAGREFVLFCDADGQHTATDVRAVIEGFEKCDMCVGMRVAGSHQPAIRAPGKLILRWFANALAGERIPDLNSGLRLLPKALLAKYLHLLPGGFSFSTTLTFALLKGGYLIRWVPIVARKRGGRSTVRQFRHGSQAVMLVLRLAVLFEPLRVFLSVAAVLFLLALVSGSIDVLYGSQGIGDVTVLLSIATLLVFMSGLLCDQVSALRRELHE